MLPFQHFFFKSIHSQNKFKHARKQIAVQTFKENLFFPLNFSRQEPRREDGRQVHRDVPGHQPQRGRTAGGDAGPDHVEEGGRGQRVEPQEGPGAGGQDQGGLQGHGAARAGHEDPEQQVKVVRESACPVNEWDPLDEVDVLQEYIIMEWLRFLHWQILQVKSDKKGEKRN